MHSEVWASANLATFRGDHPAVCRFLSLTSGRESGAPGLGPVCSSSVVHIAHMNVCASVCLSTWAGTRTWVCERACPCVCPRECLCTWAYFSACVWVYLCERVCAQLHVPRCVYLCVLERDNACRGACTWLCEHSYQCVCPRGCLYTGGCPSACVWVCLREHMHRFMHMGVCMYLCVKVLALGHVCVGTRDHVVRSLHMGVSLCVCVCVRTVYVSRSMVEMHLHGHIVCV